MQLPDALDTARAEVPAVAAYLMTAAENLAGAVKVDRPGKVTVSFDRHRVASPLRDPGKVAGARVKADQNQNRSHAPNLTIRLRVPVHDPGASGAAEMNLPTSS